MHFPTKPTGSGLTFLTERTRGRVGTGLTLSRSTSRGITTVLKQPQDSHLILTVLYKTVPVEDTADMTLKLWEILCIKTCKQ